MRARPTTLLVAVATALALGPATTAVADEPDSTPHEISWSPDLSAGQAVGVLLDSGGVRLEPQASPTEPTPAPRPTTPVAAAEASDPPPVGTLTMPVRRLDAPAERFTATIDADVPAGSTAGVELRGKQAAGWGEWTPSDAEGSVALDQPSSEVEVRLTMQGSAGTGPTVRAVRVTGQPVTSIRAAAAKPAQPLSYRVYASREGLVGGKTANGHVITDNDMFVALPSRRALSDNGKTDYSVKVCAANGRCAWVPVWDVGPWNTHDDYWNPPTKRENWQSLPQGVPEAQIAFTSGFNGGLDGFSRKVANPAGIDLADGVFRNALQLKTNAYVTVTYLWTGPGAAKAVSTEGGPVEVRAAPNTEAATVGLAAPQASLAVECSVPASNIAGTNGAARNGAVTNGAAAREGCRGLAADRQR